jgi:hypothetical protein
MTKNSQDILARAYATLSSLRKNIDQMTALVPEAYVNEFHSVLTKLEGIEIDVSEFRIPDSAVQPEITSRTRFREGEEISYSKEKYVDRSFILTKLDAILGYFKIFTKSDE